MESIVFMDLALYSKSCEFKYTFMLFNHSFLGFGMNAVPLI